MNQECIKAEGRFSFCLFLQKNRYVLTVLLIMPFFFFPAFGFAQTPLSGFNPALLADVEKRVFLDGRAFGANNVFALRSIFIDEWDRVSEPRKKNNADLYWYADTGVAYKGWRVAGFYRGELFIEANEDTVEILSMLNLKQDLPVGRKFIIDLKAKGFSATGIEISKGVRLDGLLKGLSAGITARYLRGERIQTGAIGGSVTPEGPKSYDFDLFLDYVYDENYVYDRRDTGRSFTGQGYSFDFGLKYNVSDRVIVNILLRDIMGRIYWRDVPYTTADATSDTKSYDDAGYQQFRPTIRGFESHKHYTQRIPLKTDLAFSYGIAPFELGATINLIENRPLYWVHASYIAGKDFYLKSQYNTNYEVFSIGLAYKNAFLEIYSSDIILRRANAAGLSASVRYEW